MISKSDKDSEVIAKFINAQFSKIPESQLSKIYRNIYLLTLLMQLERSKQTISEKQSIVEGLEGIPKEENQYYSIKRGQSEKVIYHRITSVHNHILKLPESEQQAFIKNILHAN